MKKKINKMVTFETITTKQLGAKIKKLREGFGFTQVQTAKKAGISVSSFRRIENAKCIAKVIMLFGISKALKIKLSDLLSNK